MSIDMKLQSSVVSASARAVELDRRSFLAGLGPGVCQIVFGDFPGGAFGRPLLTLAHCADPQLGFCRVDGADRPLPGAYEEDLARVEREIDIINKLNVDVALFCGDMVHEASDMTKDWPRLLKRFKVPVVVAPGNHDVGNEVDSEKLALFKSVFGADYRSVTVNGWKIIATNAQYAHTPGIEQVAHDAWLDQELMDGKSSRMPMIVMNHIPPFADSLLESDSYNNLPSAGRIDYLEKMVSAGVRFHLSGHLHRTLKREYGRMPILNPEVTCRSFDSRPLGFRILKIYSEGGVYTWEYVSVT